VYSGRNLGSPGFGGPGGIFTYPAVRISLVYTSDPSFALIFI